MNGRHRPFAQDTFRANRDFSPLTGRFARTIVDTANRNEHDRESIRIRWDGAKQRETHSLSRPEY
jgi:hypothetical protein